MNTKLKKLIQYRKELDDIRNQKTIPEKYLKTIVEGYMISENIMSSGGWPPVAYYRHDFVHLPKITVEYPSGKLREDNEYLKTYKIPDDEQRRENLLKEVISRFENDDRMRDGVYRLMEKDFKPGFLDEYKVDFDELVLRTEEEYIDYLYEKLFKPLNDYLKENELPLLNITYIDFYDDGHGTYTHFNIENWSTTKIILNEFGGFGNQLDGRLTPEIVIAREIDEAKEWMSQIIKNNSNRDEVDKKVAYMKTRDRILHTYKR